MATSACLEDVKNIDQRTKDCVFGYIRKIQDIFPEDNVYFTIPSLVIHWVLLYFYTAERFEIYGKNSKVSDDGKIVTNTTGCWSTVYGNVKIPSLNKRMYKWRFKIIDRTGWMAVGIDETKYVRKDRGGFEDHEGESKIYVLWHNGEKLDWETDVDDVDNLLSYDTGDTVEMTLNLMKQTLCFSINNNEAIKAFENITIGQDITYCMAVCTSACASSIQLMD